MISWCIAVAVSFCGREHVQVYGIKLEIIAALETGYLLKTLVCFLNDGHYMSSNELIDSRKEIWMSGTVEGVSHRLSYLPNELFILSISYTQWRDKSWFPAGVWFRHILNAFNCSWARKVYPPKPNDKGKHLTFAIMNICICNPLTRGTLLRHVPEREGEGTAVGNALKLILRNSGCRNRARRVCLLALPYAFRKNITLNNRMKNIYPQAWEVNTEKNVVFWHTLLAGLYFL